MQRFALEPGRPHAGIIFTTLEISKRLKTPDETWVHGGGASVGGGHKDFKLNPSLSDSDKLEIQV